jgi:C1A family cysteine protease
VGFVSNTELLATIPTAPKAKGEGYFILKNSWRQCYGDAGYYYMATEYVKALAQSIYIVSSPK